jgi:hypothetical protein
MGVMRNLLLILLLISILPLCSCSRKEAVKLNDIEIDINNFKYKEIKIRTSYTLGIAGCLNWYTDFGSIKKSVIYRNRIISVGLYGGFVCFDKNSFKVDAAFTKKINSDLFTNVSIIEDTLYAELFNKIYYLDNKTNWVHYNNPKPIKYFDTLLDDKDYVFYYSDSGEWGSILFAFNKNTKLTHGLITSCPSSVTKINNEYFVNAATRHMGIWTDLIKVSDVERLKVISDTLRLHRYSWDRFYKQINDTSDIAIQYIKHLKYFKSNWDTAIISSFSISNKIYSFIQADRRPYIGKIVNDNYKLLDTISHEINPVTIVSYADNEKIVNEGSWSNGFCLIRNDTIYKITFENNYIPIKQTATLAKNYTFNLNNENHWSAKSGQAEREIEYDFKNEYKVIGLYGNGLDGNYIIHNNKKSRLKILSDWNFIDYIYVANGNLFLNFMNLGNIDHKYNLIEITDIEKFIDKYSEN